MKILQVTAFFSPVHGGSAEVPHHLSTELAKNAGTLLKMRPLSPGETECIQPI